MSPTYWSARMGNKLYKENVFRSFASFREEAVLKDGQIVDRPYRSDIVVETYAKGTALTAQDISATSNQLTVNRFKALLIYVDNVDRVQNKYDAVNLWADEAATRMANIIDAYVLYEVVNAADTIDDGDIGGTAGNPLTLSTANVLNVFSKTNLKLDVLNVPRTKGERFGAISSQFYDILFQYVSGKQTMLGDATAKNGSVGQFAGFELYMTNNLTSGVVWTPANDPSDADTITIQGITFTFKTTIGTTPGNVLRGTSVAATITALAGLINSGGVTTDAGVSNVSLSTANQRIVQNWVAVDGTTYIEIRCKGASTITATGSDATDVFSKYTQHNFFGRNKCVDVVIQKNPSVDMASTVAAGKSGMNILPLTMFGTKLFYQGTLECLDVQINAANF